MLGSANVPCVVAPLFNSVEIVADQSSGLEPASCIKLVH